MADQIKQVEAIGAVTGQRVSEWSYPQARAGERPAPPQGLMQGAPADVVELSVDAQAIRQLPPTVYLKFFVNPADRQVVVQVINSETDEVIRQIPPTDLHRVIKALQ